MADQATKENPAQDAPTTATEWVVIAALILVVIIGGITLLGERVSGEKAQEAGQVGP